MTLARTLAPRPVAMLLDEPFSNLDAGMRREMRDLKEVVADLTLENRVLKKSVIADGDDDI